MKKRNTKNPEDLCRAGLKHYEQTQYPAIFNKVYWGGFKETCKIYILKNRNAFVKEFKIKAVAKYPWTSHRALVAFDHVENYITEEKGYVMIISPYADSADTPGIKEAVALGFRVYNKMYSPDAITLIQTFKTKEDLKAFGALYDAAVKRKR
jgi:hypothetical protein